MSIQGLLIQLKNEHNITYEHSIKCGNYLAMLAEELNKDKETIQTYREAGYLHDIGKLAIMEYVKSDVNVRDLSDEESKKFRSALRQHVKFAPPIIKSQTQWKQEYLDAAKYHHCYYNDCTQGYSYETETGEKNMSPIRSALPDVAQMLSVVDVYEALTDPNRAYRNSALSDEKVKNIMETDLNDGHFNPKIYKVFVEKIIPRIKQMPEEERLKVTLPNIEMIDNPMSTNARKDHRNTETQTENIDKIAEELRNIYPYFKMLNDNMQKMDANQYAYNASPKLDTTILERAKKITEILHKYTEDPAIVPPKTISNVYRATESMQKIYKIADRNSDWYGKPIEYINESRTKSGEFLYKAEQRVAKKTFKELNDAMDKIGYSMELTPELAQDFAEIRNLVPKFISDANNVIRATHKEPPLITIKKTDIRAIKETLSKYRDIENPNTAQKAVCQLALGCIEISNASKIAEEKYKSNVAGAWISREKAQNAIIKIEDAMTYMKKRMHTAAEGASIYSSDKETVNLMLKDNIQDKGYGQSQQQNEEDFKKAQRAFAKEQAKRLMRPSQTKVLENASLVNHPTPKGMRFG